MGRNNTTTATTSSKPATTTTQKKKKKKLVIIVAGPTGVGKSSLAALLCTPQRSSKILEDHDRICNIIHHEDETSNNKNENSNNKNNNGIGHIISADSVQVYKDLTIGANKPTPHELQSVKHHLIDIVNVNETAGNAYGAAQWMNDCLYIIDSLLNNQDQQQQQQDQKKQQQEGNNGIDNDNNDEYNNIDNNIDNKNNNNNIKDETKRIDTQT